MALPVHSTAPSPAPVPDAPAIALPRVDQRMFKVGLGLVAAMAFYFVYQWRSENIIHLYQGLLIFILAALPSLLWAKRGDGSFPLMEVFMLTTFNTYAVPLLTGHESLVLYSDEVITSAANVILVYQVAAIATFYIIRGQPKRTSFWVDEIVSEGVGKFLTYGLAATTVYAFASTFLHDAVFAHLPAESEGILRAAFFGLGIICTFIICRRWGLGLLKQGERVFLVANLVIQFFVQSASLLLIVGISTIVLALLGYISGSRKMPVVALGIIVAVVAVLHNGKSAMREKYWAADAKGITFTGLPAYYVEWVRYGLQRDETSQRNTAAKLFDRTSLFQIICLVVDRTPSRQPYLGGETYAHIPGQFIPRFFWPDKPVAHESTYRLSLYYGLQTEEDTKATTIGFGMVSEAYANFGFIGVGLIGCLFGLVFKKVSVWTRFSPMLSYGGLILVLLMAWSFQTELTLSIWLSSLFQACVAVLLTPFVLRNFIS
jgi:hypothetical protein